MRVFKKAAAVLMSAAMLAQSVVPVMAAPADNTYYYVAIGDSATAGYNLDTLTTEQRNRSRYMNYTYKSAIRDAYPTIVASALSDALVEEGYITDASKFDFSNLGTIAFRTKDFYDVLKDEDHISELMRPTYENSYGAAYASYKEDPEAFKENARVTSRTQLRELLDNYSKNYGDSSLKNTLTNVGMSWNSEEAFRTFYETYCSSDEAFAAWYDGVFDNYYYNRYLPEVRGDIYKYHDIYIDEYSKADMISANIGSNDLLLNLMFELRDQASDRQNPVMYIIYRALSDLVLGGNEVTVYVNVQANILRYRAYTTPEHIAYAQEFLSESHINEILEGYTDAALEWYPQVIEAIKEINHAAGKDAQIVYLGTYYPYANAPELPDVDETESVVLNSGAADCPKLETEEDFVAFVAAAEAAFGQEYMELPELEDGFVLFAEEAETDEGGAGAEIDEAGEAVLNANTEEQQSAVDAFYSSLDMNALIEQISVASVPCMAKFISFVKQYAEADGAPYVDLYDVSDEENADPHPLAVTHKKIADRVIDVVIEQISKTVTGKGTVDGPSKVVYGHDAEYVVTPDEGYKIKSVAVNGDVTELDSEKAYEFALTDVVDDVEITAEFEKIPVEGVTNYTLTFESNGGSEIESIEAEEGSLITLFDYKPTRDGYTFAGWFSDAELTKEVASLNLNEDTTIYAKWTQNESSSSSASIFGRLINRIFNRFDSILNGGSGSSTGDDEPGTEPGTEPGGGSGSSSGGRLTLRGIFERMGLLRPSNPDSGSGTGTDVDPGTGTDVEPGGTSDSSGSGSILQRMIGRIIWIFS